MNAWKSLSVALVVSFCALGAEPLKTFVGWPVVVPGAAQRVAVVDGDIADAQVTPDGVKIAGRKQGATVVRIWRSKADQPELVSLQVERAGWNLKPVLVAALDLEEGTVVTTSMLEERQLPEALLTSSVVKPEAARYLMGQKLNLWVQKGDLLLWTAFEIVKKK